jgi:hypothetical protein
MWFVGVLTLLASALFSFICWQLLAYRNPALQLREDALVLYGTAIPWTAIRSTYLGTANLTMIATGVEAPPLAQDRLWIKIDDRNSLRSPDVSRQFTYRLARALLRQSAGNLAMPIVRECSLDDLAREIEERIGN